MEQKFDRNVTVSFTGHRRIDYRQRSIIKSRLTSAIIDCYEHDIRNFVSGFAQGFDMIAAECVAELKKVYPEIRLIAAIPYAGHGRTLFGHSRLQYDRLLACADRKIVLGEHYYDRCFLDRDDFMVNHSSRLIAYYDGRERGGTFYTIRKAGKQGIPIVNVY